jgi:transcriptional regulator with XRE-family HTH domain
MRARVLGNELRILRDNANLTLEEAGAQLRLSASKVSRVESAKNKPRPQDLAAMLDLYGADPAQRALLLDLSRNAWKRGWWEHYRGVFTGAYVMLEDEATSIRLWHPQLIPGLLQTAAYAREIFRAGMPDVSDEVIEKHVRGRMNRQELFDKPDAPDYRAILDEAVLERAVGDSDVMRAQLRKLLDSASLPNVTIQVLAKAAGAHPGLDGPLVILSFPEKLVPDIAYCELFGGDLYLESAREVARSNLAMERIIEKALDPEESLDLIEGLVNR